MSNKIVYHNDAETEILEAKRWYKAKQVGLEKRFIISVRATLKYIFDNPLLFAIKYKTTRVAYLDVFPYGIHYHFNYENATITILTILHTSKENNF